MNLQNKFHANLNFTLQRGESCKIKIVFDGREYDAILTNIDFDKAKYPNHNDLLQIRYTPNSPIAKELQHIFSSSYNYLLTKKRSLKNKRTPIKVPAELAEQLIIYATEFQNVFVFDYIINSEIAQIKTSITSFTEYELENILNQEDIHATTIERYKLTKIRKLDRHIAETLKQLYDYRCQICGEKIGEKYSSSLVHAHHIEYFSKSLNNNPQNILIVCPNHHGIIHDVNPIYDILEHKFICSNGYIEPLKINYHL